ncbi:MAG: hypothetical protein QOE92_451 [Chloroflexota bacterium]|nr:hypothetical protein [Chloroflexota bacterium]
MSGLNLAGAGVVVTGASTGIGRAVALELAQRGARVAIAARSEDLLEAVADEAAAAGATRPAVLPVDLSLRGAAETLGRRAMEALGEVDVLVNNAGLAAGGAQVNAADTDPVREAMEVNYWSPMALQQVLVPPMLRRNRGAVVNVTSLGQVMVWPGLGHYSSTKAALAAATETLRLELRHTPINVMEMIPGPVWTAIQAESMLLQGFREATRQVPRGTSDGLARLLADGLEAGTHKIVYPRRLAWSYMLPGVVRAFTLRFLPRYISAEAADQLLRDGRVLRSGSRGDEENRRVREEWLARRRPA